MRTHKLILGILVPILSLAVCPSRAQDAEPVNPKLARYPLRLHVLAIDDTHITQRMQPNWCSTSIPSFGGDATSGADAGGQTGSPCGGGGTATFGGPDDFSGGGRGDLVSPPTGTQALSFTYDGCTRMRVPPGFTALAARWKSHGKLEVLVPSDAIGGSATQKCTLTAKSYEFVYLRMRNGTLLKVSQDAYLAKPSLRVFLSGGAETLQARPPQTVSVKQLMRSPQ
jgi:hypothetical protein